jgi:hypothetical protein
VRPAPKARICGGSNLSAQEPSENELLAFVREHLAGAGERHIREALDGNRVAWVRRYRLEQQQGIATPEAENDGDPDGTGTVRED